MANSDIHRPNSDHYFALAKGAMLLNFEIRSVLGYGGFGITYEALDLDLQQVVAIKEYLPNELAVRTTDYSVRAKSESSRSVFESGVKEFIEEARLLARFHHPNIVRVRRYFELHGTGYIVTDFIDGQSLSARLSRGSTDASETLGILTGILDGLEVLHDNAILHRDLKPSNVMIRENGTPVLIDFGAARDFTGRHSRSVTAIATSGYSPPEQYGTGGQQGPWTDLYALGAIAYRCVTGKPPVDSLRRLRKDPLVSARVAANGDYDPVLLATIDRLLSVNETDRPSSVAEVRALLANFLLLEGRKKSVSRPRLLTASVVLLCLIVSLAAGFSWYEWQSANLKLDAERKLNQQLAEARFDREGLSRLAEMCSDNCPELIRGEIQRRIAVINTEQQVYSAALNNSVALRSYLDRCEACLMREAAQRRTGELETEQAARLQAQRVAQEQTEAREKQAAQRKNAEVALWNSAKNANSRQLYEEYLQTYPEGTFVDVARMSLQRLTMSLSPESDNLVLTDPQLLAEIKERLYELNYDPDDGNDVSLRRAIVDFEIQNQLPQIGKPTQRLLVELRRARSVQPWGTIVYSRNANKWGMSWNNPSRKQAVVAARSSCAGQCAIEASFFGANCGALGSGDGIWSIVSRATIEDAKQAVIAECRQKRKACQIVAAVCASGAGRFSLAN
jgi:serine/threonine protein kinase